MPAFPALLDWRNALLISLAFRLFLAFSPSYIHPDEQLQTLEPIIAYWFKWDTSLPWEYTAKNPARSVFSLNVLLGWPLYVFRGWLKTPRAVLLAARLYTLLFSWIGTDVAFAVLCSIRGGAGNYRKAAFFVMTSYVTWTYQSHTFTNSYEAVLVLWCLVLLEIVSNYDSVVSAAPQRVQKGLAVQLSLLGALSALGVFNRITFAAFVVVPGAVTLLRHFRRFPGSILPLFATFGAVAAYGLAYDTRVFSESDATFVLFGRPVVIAPVNSLLYNTSTANLATHGIHSRFTHILVNFPGLLGVSLLFLRRVPALLRMGDNFALSMVSGLVLLSLIPHQEPRFLQPLVPIAAVLADIRISDTISRRLVALSLVFNTVMGVFYGVYHQAGVIPAVLHLHDTLRPYGEGNSDVVVFWRTYQTPTWMFQSIGDQLAFITPEESIEEGRGRQLAESAISALNNHSLVVVQAMGTSGVEAVDLLDVLKKEAVGGVNITLVAPSASVKTSEMREHLKGQLESKEGFELAETWHYSRHYNMDHLDFTDLETFVPGIGIYSLL